MRKTLRFFASLMAMMLAVGGISAQAPMPPQLFTYQAVVRDGSNHIVRNATVGVQITIMQSNPTTGTQVYQEIHSATTNVNGAFTVIVGSSATATGTIAAIDWSNGPYYLVSQVDINNDLAYDITTTQQLVSVPYALYCETCANCGGGGGGSYTETQGLSDVVAINNSANNNQLKNLKDPTDPQDAMTKRIIDSITHRYDSILAALTACCGGGGGGSTPCAASAGTVNISGTSAICSGVGTTLTASATGNRGTLSYQWKKDGVDLPGETNATYTATTAGNYTVVVTATDGTCTPTSATANASLNVTVGTAPVLTWNTNPAAASICSGSNTALTANVTADGGETVTYTWSPATGLNTTTGASVTASPTATTTYTVTASATSATGCPVSENKTATVTVETPNLTLGNILFEGTPSTTATFTTGVNKTFAANISTQSGTGRIGYAWSTSQGGAAVSSASSLTLNESTTGSMTLWLRVFDTTAAGCSTYKDKSIAVTVTADCEVTISNLKWTATSPICAGLPFALTASADVAPAGATLSWKWYRSTRNASQDTSVYSWSGLTSAPYYKGDNNQILYAVESNQSGTHYKVVLTATYNGCTVSKLYSHTLSPSAVNNAQSTKNLTSLARNNSTLTIISPGNQPYTNMMYSIIPENTAGTDPSLLLWQSFTTGTYSTTETKTVPACAGKMYYWSSPQTTAQCPTQSNGGSIKDKTYN